MPDSHITLREQRTTAALIAQYIRELAGSGRPAQTTRSALGVPMDDPDG